MEDMMEIKQEKKKIGAGIMTISIIYIVLQAFGIIGTLVTFFIKDTVNAATAGTGVEITSLQLVISLALTVICLVSVILIMAKKAIGVVLFAGIIVLNFVYTIITSGFSVYLVIGLILPALMLFFIYRKKDIYFKKA